MAPYQKRNAPKAPVLDLGQRNYPNPHPARIAAIKKWHLDQALTDQRPISSVNVTITAECEVRTSIIGDEPALIPRLVEALRSAADELERDLPPPSGANITRLHR